MEVIVIENHFQYKGGGNESPRQFLPPLRLMVLNLDFWLFTVNRQ
ncbi:MAG: hypothetical protein ACYC3H_07965 [Bellilinea sp.]